MKNFVLVGYNTQISKLQPDLYLNTHHRTTSCPRVGPLCSSKLRKGSNQSNCSDCASGKVKKIFSIYLPRNMQHQQHIEDEEKVVCIPEDVIVWNPEKNKPWFNAVSTQMESLLIKSRPVHTGHHYTLHSHAKQSKAQNVFPQAHCTCTQLSVEKNKWLAEK